MNWINSNLQYSLSSFFTNVFPMTINSSNKFYSIIWIKIFRFLFLWLFFSFRFFPCIFFIWFFFGFSFVLFFSLAFDPRFVFLQLYFFKVFFSIAFFSLRFLYLRFACRSGHWGKEVKILGWQSKGRKSKDSIIFNERQEIWINQFSLFSKITTGVWGSCTKRAFFLVAKTNASFTIWSKSITESTQKLS